MAPPTLIDSDAGGTASNAPDDVDDERTNQNATKEGGAGDNDNTRRLLHFGKSCRILLEEPAHERNDDGDDDGDDDDGDGSAWTRRRSSPAIQTIGGGAHDDGVEGDTRRRRASVIKTVARDADHNKDSDDDGDCYYDRDRCVARLSNEFHVLSRIQQQQQRQWRQSAEGHTKRRSSSYRASAAAGAMGTAESHTSNEDASPSSATPPGRDFHAQHAHPHGNRRRKSKKNRRSSIRAVLERHPPTGPIESIQLEHVEGISLKEWIRGRRSAANNDSGEKKDGSSSSSSEKEEDACDKGSNGGEGSSGEEKKDHREDEDEDEDDDEDHDDQKKKDQEDVLDRIHVAHGICGALAEVHELGVVHRDVSASSFVVDFQLIKATKEGEKKDDEEEEGMEEKDEAADDGSGEGHDDIDRDDAQDGSASSMPTVLMPRSATAATSPPPQQTRRATEPIPSAEPRPPSSDLGGTSSPSPRAPRPQQSQRRASDSMEAPLAPTAASRPPPSNKQRSVKRISLMSDLSSRADSGLSEASSSAFEGKDGEDYDRHRHRDDEEEDDDDDADDAHRGNKRDDKHRCHVSIISFGDATFDDHLEEDDCGERVNDDVPALGKVIRSLFEDLKGGGVNDDGLSDEEEDEGVGMGGGLGLDDLGLPMGMGFGGEGEGDGVKSPSAAAPSRPLLPYLPRSVQILLTNLYDAHHTTTLDRQLGGTGKQPMSSLEWLHTTILMGLFP